MEGNERITNGQKLFAERLFELWKDYRPVEHEFPKETPTIIWPEAFFREWVFKVSNRSPLVRALNSFRNSVTRLIEDIDRWAVALALRSQNKDGSPFRQHPLVMETLQHTSLALKATDVVLRAVAGPKFDKLDWVAAGDHYAMQSDTFRKLLFDRFGALLDVQHQDIERIYPWMVRYTDNIPRDAPSQLPLYRKIMGEMAIRTVSTEEIIRWHNMTRPVSTMLIVDLETRWTAENDSDLQQQRYEETINETGGWDGTKTYGGTDRYVTIVQESWDTPLKPPLEVGVSTSSTPRQRTTGLRPEDLNLWGSGTHSRNSQRNVADDTAEEAQLLARLAVLKAKKQETPKDVPIPNSLTRSTYSQVDLWGSPQVRPGTSASMYSTRDFIVPRHDDVNSGGGGFEQDD